MESRRRPLLLIAAFALPVAACILSTAVPEPQVWIDEPTEGNTFNLGDPVLIMGHVSRPEDVSEIQVLINGETIYRLLPSESDPGTASFRAIWISVETGEQLVQVAVLDADGGVIGPVSRTFHVVTVPTMEAQEPDCPEPTETPETQQPSATPTSTPTLTPTPKPTSPPIPSPTPDTTGPPAPEVVSPVSNIALSCTPYVLLSWNTVSDPSGIDHYDIEVQVDPAGGWDPYNSWTAASPKQFPHDCGRDYRWRVRAVDGVGNEGPFSVWGTYTIKP